MDEDGNGSAEIKTPIFSASLKGKDIQLRDVIGLLILIGVLIVGSLVYQHNNEAAASQKSTQDNLKDSQRDLASAIKELAAGQKEMVQAQREQNCLIAFPQDVREARANFCKQIAR